MRARRRGQATQEAEAALRRIAAEGTAGYRMLARLREAALPRATGKAAVAAYDAIAADPRVGQKLRDLAAVARGIPAGRQRAASTRCSAGLSR